MCIANAPQNLLVDIEARCRCAMHSYACQDMKMANETYSDFSPASQPSNIALAAF